MTIKQTVELNASPQRIYEILLSPAEFGAMTGAPAEIADEEGGEFSCFGGQITGRHIQLEPGRRIVQAWRAGPWDDGVYSIVKFDISGSGDSSTLRLVHTGYPNDAAEHLEGGWHKMYWEPMQAFLD